MYNSKYNKGKVLEFLIDLSRNHCEENDNFQENFLNNYYVYLNKKVKNYYKAIFILFLNNKHYFNYNIGLFIFSYPQISYKVASSTILDSLVWKKIINNTVSIHTKRKSKPNYLYY